MKNYRIVFISLALIVIWGLGCQPESTVKTNQAIVNKPKEKAPVAAAEAPAAKVETPVKEKKAVKKATVTAKPAEAKPATKAVASKAPAPQASVPEANKPADANEVAVTVNGVNILEGQIAEKIVIKLKAMAPKTPPDVVERYKKKFRQLTLDGMIVEQLLDEEAKTHNIVVTEEDVNAGVMKMAASQRPPLSLEDFKALVKAYGQSFDHVKERVQKGMTYQKLIESQFPGDANVTEADALKYYTDTNSQFVTPEKIRASHILIAPDPNNTDPNKAKADAKAKAKSLLAKIRAGADFATLAKENSACPSAAKGGDLGLFERGTMVVAFEDVAFKLKVGQISDVVETQFGYHIIKVTDHNAPGIIPFEQVKKELRENLKQRKQHQFATEYVEKLKAKSSIVYPPGKEPKKDDQMMQMAPGRPQDANK
jgi:peptidyl-prolyl cis-trans isomerase C